MAEKKTVSEVAELYGVTSMAVRHWIKNGLKTDYEKVIGIKKRIILDLDDVAEYLKLKSR
jgi:predicted transcriptional regulator